jgi:hypothetical protein
MSASHCLLAGFNGRHVAVECRTEWLAMELRRRLRYVVVSPQPIPPVILRLTLDELQVSWIEVRDSTGRCERGSFEYASYHARKWMTTAFVAAHPNLTWLHAAAASREGFAILLAGPAGAGKSTLLVELIERGWRLLADDVVAVRPNRGEALPLPFSPEVRATPRGLEQDWPAFLAQPKALATIAPDRVASKPAAVAAIMFPEYARDVTHPLITPLTVVSAAQALATQALSARHGGANIGELFCLARQIPCYRLRYADSSAAVGELASFRRSGRSQRKDC